MLNLCNIIFTFHNPDVTLRGSSSSSFPVVYWLQLSLPISYDSPSQVLGDPLAILVAFRAPAEGRSHTAGSSDWNGGDPRTADPVGRGFIRHSPTGIARVHVGDPGGQRALWRDCGAGRRPHRRWGAGASPWRSVRDGIGYERSRTGASLQWGGWISHHDPHLDEY